MKRTYSLLIAILFFMGFQETIAQVKMPAASPQSTINQAVGLVDVQINYSRPSVKGRKIFGEMLPYGEIWRTGANASTKITFSDTVKIQGNTVPAGTYALYTIPEKDKWTVIVSRSVDSWGAGSYKAADDAARFEVKPSKNPKDVETFIIYFSDLTSNSANLNLAWEKVLVSFKIETDTDKKVLASIDETMASGNATANDYNSAASYLFESGKDLNKALEYVDAAIEKFEEQQRNVFWVHHLKAKIHGKLNQFDQAIKAAEKSKSQAQEANNQDYVRLNDKLIKEWQTKGKS